MVIWNCCLKKKHHHKHQPLVADSLHQHPNYQSELSREQKYRRFSTNVTWLSRRCIFYLAQELCKHGSVAVLPGPGVRIWVWPWIIHGGSQLLQCRLGGYEFGLKSNIRTTSKDNPRRSLVRSAAAQVSRPHNTSLTSKLSRQNKTAGVMCSENVFTCRVTLDIDVQ